MAGEFIAAPECIPCALRQVLSAARRVSDDKWFHGEVLKQVMAAMARADLRRSPAEVSLEALKEAGRLFGVRDPFAEEKRADNARVMAILPDLRRKVAESTDPLYLASRLAVAGNIMDLGILPGVDPSVEVNRALSEPLAVDDGPAFREAARAARSVLYLLDNAGEIVLDRLLIEQLRRKDVTCLVRAEPIINDVTKEDAEQVGLNEVCKVIEPGAPMLGLVLSLASPEVREAFERSDLVISKGQANFETLANAEREVFFLLRAKCPIVAEALGVKVSAPVLVRHEPGKPHRAPA
jgi:uncharacterized protein with ATP-grasp and redox domains